MIPCITVRRSILIAGTTVAALLAHRLLPSRPPHPHPPHHRQPPRNLCRRDRHGSAAPMVTRLPPSLPPSPVRRCRRPPTSCRPPSSSCRQASTLRSMPAVSPTPALYVSATRERCLSAPALATKSPPL